MYREDGYCSDNGTIDAEVDELALLDNANHPLAGKAAADESGQEADGQGQQLDTAHHGLALDGFQHVEQSLTQNGGDDHQE